MQVANEVSEAISSATMMGGPDIDDVRLISFPSHIATSRLNILLFALIGGVEEGARGVGTTRVERQTDGCGSCPSASSSRCKSERRQCVHPTLVYFRDLHTDTHDLFIANSETENRGGRRRSSTQRVTSLSRDVIPLFHTWSHLVAVFPSLCQHTASLILCARTFYSIPCSYYDPSLHSNPSPFFPLAVYISSTTSLSLFRLMFNVPPP